MVNILLKNVEHAEQARQVIQQRFEPLIHEFPDLREHQVFVVVDGASEAERSGGRPMSVKAIVHGQRYRAIALVQTVSDLCAASANVAGRLWRRLKRTASQARTRSAERRRANARPGV